MQQQQLELPRALCGCLHVLLSLIVLLTICVRVIRGGFGALRFIYVTPLAEEDLDQAPKALEECPLPMLSVQVLPWHPFHSLSPFPAIAKRSIYCQDFLKYQSKKSFLVLNTEAVGKIVRD